jgi:hypothetical protein
VKTAAAWAGAIIVLLTMAALALLIVVGLAWTISVMSGGWGPTLFVAAYLAGILVITVVLTFVARMFARRKP